MSVYPEGSKAFCLFIVRKTCDSEFSVLQAWLNELLRSLLLLPWAVLAIEGTAMLEGRAGLCSCENSEMQ